MPKIPHAELLYVRRQWARTLIDTYAFGMYTVMVVMTFYNLLKRGNAWSANRIVLIYTIFMFCVTVGWYYSQTRIDEAQTLELLAAGPGASSNHGVADSCSALSNITNVLSVVQFWGNDALMLYRATMVFPRNRLILILPSAVFLAFFGVALATLTTCAPAVHLANTLAVGLAFYSLSALLNVLITSMIATKLLLHRRRMTHNHVRMPGSADVYISTIGMLVESAAPYSVSLVVFVILRGTNNRNYAWFEGVMMAMSFLSQASIILRISMGTTSIQTDSASAESEANMPLAFGPRHLARSTFLQSHTNSAFVHKGQPGSDMSLNPGSGKGTHQSV